ncbi:hypothetical protein SAMN05192588_2410 [Nonlabens sp. Hel1_33_55]|nr:hypothetical protein SAMN05192588_2410 [Nonlabens sp. Hel1_33_55]
MDDSIPALGIEVEILLISPYALSKDCNGKPDRGAAEGTH